MFPTAPANFVTVQLSPLKKTLRTSSKFDMTQQQGEVVCVLTRHAMKVYGGVDAHLHAFLVSALNSRVVSFTKWLSPTGERLIVLCTKTKL